MNKLTELEAVLQEATAEDLGAKFKLVKTDELVERRHQSSFDHLPDSVLDQTMDLKTESVLTIDEEREEQIDAIMSTHHIQAVHLEKAKMMKLLPNNFHRVNQISC